MAANALAPEPTFHREIVVSRVFDAPRDRVYQAFADPVHVANWWAPNGFSCTVHAMDVRPGGLWRFVVHGPDGTDHPNRVIYEEVQPAKRLVYRHGTDNDLASDRFHVTITFLDKGPRTEVILACAWPTEQDFAKVEPFAVEAGNGLLIRLAEYLPRVAAAGDSLVIVRTFRGHKDVVFRAWTDPDQLAEWWGPKGLPLTVEQSDLQPGGMFLYRTRSADGHEWWGRLVYTEIVVNERLEFVTAYSDPHGGLGHHPLAPSWPSQVLNTVTFIEHGDATRIVLEASPIEPTDEERANFAEGRLLLQQGFAGMFLQLDAFLAHRT
jgi:uncharacterized protein YndB with AHSA1/START domain